MKTRMTLTKLPDGLEKIGGLDVEETLEIVKRYNPDSSVTEGPDFIPGYVRVHTVEIRETDLRSILDDIQHRIGSKIEGLALGSQTVKTVYPVGAIYNPKGYQGFHLAQDNTAREVTFLRLKDSESL